MLLCVCLFIIWIHVIVCMSVHDMGSCYCVYVCSSYGFMLLCVCLFMLLCVCLFMIWVHVIVCMSVHDIGSCCCVYVCS